MNLQEFESLRFNNAPAFLYLEIGELVFRINSDDKTLFQTASEYYSAFVTSKKNTDFTIDVYTNPFPLPQKPGTVPFSVEQIIFQERSIIRSQYFKGFADREHATAKLICLQEDAFSWLEHFFRNLYSWLILRYSGCIFHGAGLVHNNRGFVFFGPGGTGKSTVTQLSPDCGVLGDDLVILRRIGKDFFIYGAPFNIGSERKRIKNQKIAIHSIYRLRQDKNNYLKKANNSIAASELMSNVPVIHQDPNACDIIFTFMEQLVNKIPYFDLFFTKDNYFWKVINEHFREIPEKG